MVVNLYPFEATAARPDLTVEELIENIDIGGPAMVRSASKNFESVAVVTDPADYPALAEELSEQRRLESGDASGAGAKGVRGDRAIRRHALLPNSSGCRSSDGKVTLGERPLLPARLHFALARHAPMRYGENPHQKAALYIPAGQKRFGVGGRAATARQGAFLQ